MQYSIDPVQKEATFEKIGDERRKLNNFLTTLNANASGCLERPGWDS